MPYPVPRLFTGTISAIAARIMDSCAPMPMPQSATPMMATEKFPKKTNGAKSMEKREAMTNIEMPLRSNRYPKKSAAMASTPIAMA